MVEQNANMALSIADRGYVLQTGRVVLADTAHDLHSRPERFTPYDLIVSEFRGDVKTSTYFLSLTGGVLGNDFYITRLWLSGARSQTLVVFLKPLMWDEIDGKTLLVAWRELESCLPQPVRIAHRGRELVVSDYGAWKEKRRALPDPTGGAR